MRVIGRNKAGRIVGCFERCSPKAEDLLVQRLDACLRPVEQICLDGFRETVAWLHSIGAVQFECVEQDALPLTAKAFVHSTRASPGDVSSRMALTTGVVGAPGYPHTSETPAPTAPRASA